MSIPPSTPEELDEYTTRYLRGLGADAFAELQRGDVKAGTLCAAAGGGLGAVIAVTSTATQELPVCVMIALWCVGGCFLVSMGLSMAALRPSLRTGERRRPVCYLDCADATAEQVLVAVAELTRLELARVESRRVAELSSLARAKFRLLRKAAIWSQFALATAGLAATALLTDITVATWLN
ncbi:Pycsar system effector family protein [Streptomyces abikoensis]|uniref:Pycsar system effector family protein n=1 Tax=Streptomyces abikoensis TaxID=97398 RepID=UPI00371BDCFB